MANDNQLGRLLRERRKALGKKLADVSREIPCSVSYLSRIENGQSPEGPSVAFLERIAPILDLTAQALIKLNEADRQPSFAVNNQDAVPSQSHSEIARLLAPLDERERRHVIDLARFGASALSRIASQQPGASLQVGPEVSGDLREALVALAVSMERVAEEYLVARQHLESVSAYKEAFRIYDGLSMPGDAAVTIYRTGRVYAAMTSDPDASAADCAEHLLRADHYFRNAHVRFLGHRDSLTDTQRALVPANMAAWSRNDRKLAQQIPLATTRADSDLGLWQAELTPTSDQPIPSYIASATGKARLAEEELLNWIAILKARESQTWDVQWELASAHSRVATLLMERCVGLGSGDRPDDTTREGLVDRISEASLFALSLRRTMLLRRQDELLAAGKRIWDDEEAQTCLERIAYGHSAYAWNLHLCCGNPAYARVLWHYSVSAKIYRLFPLERHSVRREDAIERLNVVEAEGADAGRRLVRRHVLEEIAKIEFVRNVDGHDLLVLDYPLEYDAGSA